MKQNYTVITHAPEVGIYSSTYVVAENKEEAIKRALSDIYGSVYDELPTKKDLENFDEEVVGVIEGNVRVDFSGDEE
jgi:hypothetical protein